MAIVINADSQTVLTLGREDRGDNDALSLLTARTSSTAAAPRDEFAAMRQVESEVYRSLS